MARTSCDCGCWLLISGLKPTTGQFSAVTAEQLSVLEEEKFADKIGKGVMHSKEGK